MNEATVKKLLQYQMYSSFSKATPKINAILNPKV